MIKMNENKIKSLDVNASGFVLSDKTQDDFIEFVNNRFGIVIKRQHKDLLKQIEQDCLRLSISPELLLEKLTVADDQDEMISHIINSITIGESYFFRDKQQMKVLQEYVLPSIIAEKRAQNLRSIRIWSAGCSSGEEIYTIIMLLRNLIPDLDHWQYFFLATDINIDVLRKAIAGSYGEWSMRSIPVDYLNKYFTKDKSIYVLSDEVRNMATFSYLNLNDDTYPSIMNGTVMHDLIICRNVLIYFDVNHVKHIVQRLSNCIHDDGYIMLGASDPMSMMQTGLSSSGKCPSLYTKGRVSYDVLEKKNQVDVISTVHEDVQPHNTDNNHGINVEPKSAKLTEISLMEDAVHAAASDARWDDVLHGITILERMTSLNTKIQVEKAVALANTGKTTDALAVCETVIAADHLNKKAYFIKALALVEIRHYSEAESAFKKALFLDPDYLVCRYQLGMLLIRNKKRTEGLKALQNVVLTAKKFNSDDEIPDAGGLHYKDIIALINNEVSLHE